MLPFLWMDGIKGYTVRKDTYVVSSQYKPNNHVIYAVDTDLGSSIFFNDVSPCDLEIPASIGVMEE